jgi:hypothetical protein
MTSAYQVMAMLIRAGREKCAVWEGEEQNNYIFQLEHSGKKRGDAVLSVASSSSNSECMFVSTGGIPRRGGVEMPGTDCLLSSPLSSVMLGSDEKTE